MILNPALQQLYARAIGEMVIELLLPVQPKDILAIAEADALILIADIKKILDDDSLDDDQCFFKIDAIVTAFHLTGLTTKRHRDMD